jgi:nucleoside-diphosphate kinase
MKHPKEEKTFVILKPDTIQRSLTGDIINRFEKTGLKIVHMEMKMLDEDRLWKHYDKDNEWFEEKGNVSIDSLKQAGLPVEKDAISYGKDIIRGLVSFMTAGPVVVMVIEGNSAVGVVKKLVGSTEPLTSDIGTIRGDLTIDSYNLSNSDARAVRNLVHCSDKPNEAEREIKLWVEDKKILKYRHINEAILYDVNLDGISE